MKIKIDDYLKPVTGIIFVLFFSLPHQTSFFTI